MAERLPSTGTLIDLRVNGVKIDMSPVTVKAGERVSLWKATDDTGRLIGGVIVKSPKKKRRRK